ncbi:sigma-54-dependent Fis family transcriptional regulator [Pseudonocardia endophytica]|uniref:Transcriptional regulator of acetoin/glycerol metabolism n=1 Tax=Pseudonocardia endophytica TaxID=401976 RepID=A0A4R1HX32_PSEEN|nr:helix-turn-helix domain-containing protein [Pseudonocardia endophytica]TCK26918.1 transcriptional regulator of acetoin/glycerol metabolism [Pseudonocardia endophytica]
MVLPPEPASTHHHRDAHTTVSQDGGLAAPSSAAAERIAVARDAFLVDDALSPGSVRGPILASWIRSRELSVPADHLELPYETAAEPDTPLLRAARPVVAELADQFATEPVSLILCDADGVVLERRTGDSTLNQHLDKVWLAPGFSYAERYVGTNGIGTALEGRRATEVFGCEHYVEHLEDLACAGAPIRHPVSGKVVGVIDLTCWRREANALMVATASSMARRIEENLLEQSGRRELTLLQDYLTTVQRSSGAVFAVSDDLLMMNDRARELIDPADQAPLLADAGEALRSGRARQLVVDLPSGACARVHCRPSWSDGGVSGGILQVKLTSREPAAVRPAHPTITTALPAAVGSGALWAKCCQAVDRHFRTREWLVLEGEQGSGRTTLARATHQMHTPAGHVRVLDAEDFGPRWMAEVNEELSTGGGTLVLQRVDRLSASAAQALTDALEPHRESTDLERPWVVATRGPMPDAHPDAPELTELLGVFPRTIEVPPLRHHIEDVAELVPYLLSRLTRGADLTCSPEAMRVLMRNRWPGNVEQLYQVLRKVVARRRTGVIRPDDLPAETRAITRRVLTPLEAIECDAIVDALIDADGNKAEAARRLGMSRATIYRKIRGYGISVPTSGDD